MPGCSSGRRRSWRRCAGLPFKTATYKEGDPGGRLFRLGAIPETNAITKKYQQSLSETRLALTICNFVFPIEIHS
ncbi:hypothetical protein EMIT0P4_10305 [Pseudomonas sp. IT-P4]